MADNLTAEQRRKNMQAIRSQSKLEEIVTKELWNRGIRFRRNVKDLKGKPDIAIKKYKLVIFIDSCFWHVCPIHANIPKSNETYWKEKLSRNQKRDKEVTEYYLEKEWNIKRIWEHEIKNDFDKVIFELEEFINKVKNTL
ncbi:very short patch repair endonuclease [Gracilibacillus alcaliphilus]|uniref:very short patch repair endonuclease n=1 Tax=Gracilibacillus alcaliphilus TaxID=1401441 RepID=UPI00195C0849|nr:very short patch repair endonuclease [Gracilibacillus alcaliphilus]MBM7679601.1 DNA mismatch endonuclease (patch repair protein) [Gracilibacillus alcaliphilus]